MTAIVQISHWTGVSLGDLLCWAADMARQYTRLESGADPGVLGNDRMRQEATDRMRIAKFFNDNRELDSDLSPNSPKLFSFEDLQLHSFAFRLCGDRCAGKL